MNMWWLHKNITSIGCDPETVQLRATTASIAASDITENPKPPLWLTMLTGPRGAAVERALRASPDILAEASVDLVLGANALCHLLFRLLLFTGSTCLLL